MPVVLFSEEGDTETARAYDDRTGISYEFPEGRYEAWVRPGEEFVYIFRGLGYVGAGVIGDIRKSTTSGRLICDILDFKRFLEPVPLRRPDGHYWEADLSTGRTTVYWAQGVRPLNQEACDGIVTAGRSIPNVEVGVSSPQTNYPSSDVAMAVDVYAMKAAMSWAESTYPTHSVTEMPKNNPGFDILIHDLGGPHRYVEVKGTQANEPLFFISEGERKFSGAHAANYTLVAISGINLKSQEHSGLTTRDGEVTVTGCDLQPRQWSGRIPHRGK
jgi:hypothetical protein